MTVLIPINTTPAPSRVDTPNFAARADVYHAWLPTAVDAMNAQNTENNALAADVTTKSAAAVVAAAVVTSANPIVNAAAAAASAATASAASSAAAAAALASSNARDAAIAAAAVASAPTEQLSAISQSIHRGTVVKSIIYDTSKDSDGGAWRKRCTDKSWYNETLGGTGWVGQQASEALARAYIGSKESPWLVTNGTFATDTSGWTLGNSATLSAVSGKLRLTNTAALNGIAYQAITTEVGKTYLAYAEQTAGTNSSWFFYAGTTAGGNQLGTNSGPLSSVTSSTFTFVATGTTSYISVLLNATNGHCADFDNISVKLVDSAIDTSNYMYQSTADNKFYKTVSTSGTTEVRRGLTREFPALAAVVVETLRVVIYDLTQASCPMWMVFLGGDLVTGGALSFDQVTGSSANLNSSVAALNASIFIGQSPSGNGQGLRVINFVADTADRISDSTRLNTWRFKGNISRRNNADNGYQYSSAGIVNLTVNDVAVVALDSAPIDPATGLPVPTIAVATASGVSVIKDDGTVVNHTASGYTDWKRVGYTSDFRLWMHIGNDDRRIGFLKTGMSTVSTTLLSDFNVYSDPVASGQFPYVLGAVFSRYAATAGRDVCGAGTNGAFVFKTNHASFAKSMQAQITNAYNTGWLPGDIRGAYLADSVAETVTASGELVLTPDFAADTNWTKTGTASISGGVANIPADASGIYQSTATVVGRTYVYTVTVVTANAALVFYVGLNSTGGQMLDSGNVTTTGAKVYTFVAQSSTSFIRVVNFAIGGVTAVIDNISVKLTEPDRSVKNTGLVINGTLTKAAVASGAGLVAYSGFSASNYLEQPYNSNLDFGTGDFCVMGWANPVNSTGNQRLLDKSDGTTTGQLGLYFSSGQLAIAVGVGGAFLTGGLVYPNAAWSFIVVTRISGQVYTYANGVLVNTTSATQTVSNASSKTRLGLTYAGAEAFAGSMALWRISATAPSQDQIAHIYRTELPLFQPNAQCTLAGTTSSVTAMAYDEAANELHVTTAGSRSGFVDLLRVDSETLAVGTSTTVAAFEGTVITGGTTSARVYAPALNLRDELRRKEIARKALGRLPAFFDYTATASQTAFVAPKGFTIKALYKNGTLMREATTGTYWSRSNDGFQETATLSVGASVSDWISLMCVRA